MTQDKTGGPEFAHGNPEQGGHPGMTLRDWFAGQALAGMNAADRRWDGGGKDMARAAYSQADAMIAARNGGQDT